MVRAVKRGVKVPVAVKLSPFYTSLASFASRLVKAGADGLVIFNRFYQPDIDVENLEVERSLHLSTSSELNLRLRWLAIISGTLPTSLAVTGGVHTALDAIKSIMCGASAVQMVSALLQNGPQHLAAIRGQVTAWMAEHDYQSLSKMRGNMSLASCPDAGAYERANYMMMLNSWKKE
jgi:dihydroorotate dehydrogenase (fumarate)